MEDPAHPGHLNPAIGAYRCNSADSLVRAWNRSIPAEDKAAWPDSVAADAYVREALASDSETKTHQLWDASFIYVPTLVLASERDFWSRPADRDKLKQDLVHAPIARVVVIPNATHFVHLDRPQHGRQLFLNEIVSFIHGQSELAKRRPR